MDRLSLIAPDLSRRLASLGPEQRRLCALDVAQWVLDRVGALPAALRAGPHGASVSQLNQIAEQLDDDYLSLYELKEAGECSNELVDAAFSRARAATAVACAADGDVCDAIYEAVAATDDLAGLRNVVLRSIDAA